VNVQAIKEAGKKKGDQIIDDLIRAVIDVRPELPEKLLGRV